ncbi:MAG: reverse transcriptase domain-containing protein [Candidatus Thiodiazotropha sp.]
MSDLQKAQAIVEKKSNLSDLFLPTFCKINNEKSKNLASNDLDIDLNLCKHSLKCQICNNTKKNTNISDIKFLLDAHHQVCESGKYNFEGCKIPVNFRMNISYIKSWLSDYKDTKLIEFLEFGFPIGFVGDKSILSHFNSKSLWKLKNHRGAQEFSSDMEEYLQKESKHRAVAGPFRKCPFKNGIKISPLNSLPKKDTLERRVILDLSYPKGYSVNDHIDKEFYLGEKMEAVYPKVDDFIQIIKAKGPGCFLFKKDLRRAYRQIPICPSSYNLVAFSWNKHVFFDTVLSMGLRSAAYICQRVSNAIAFIMFKIGILVLNYLDDLASAEKREVADFAYNTLGEILDKCGIEESKSKSCPPSTIMTFIGILFNTEKMTIEVTPERLIEIKILLSRWLNKQTASIKEIQSLLGKLNFVASCVRPGRIFISRMLKWLKILYTKDSKQHTIPQYVKKDLLWWYRFLPLYNGVSMMVMEEWSHPDEIFSSDSCLSGCGGFWNGNYFHTIFPDKIRHKSYHINILEMLSVIICLKLWSSHFKGKRIQVFCDNASVCSVLNSGRAKCEILQDCLREIAFLSAISECEIRAVHLDTRSNRISDHLSRWHTDKYHISQFFLLTEQYTLQEHYIAENMWNFINNW